MGLGAHESVPPYKTLWRRPWNHVADENSQAKSMRAAVVPTFAAERRQQPTTPVQKATKMKKKATRKSAIIERAMSAEDAQRGQTWWCVWGRGPGGTPDGGRRLRRLYSPQGVSMCRLPALLGIWEHPYPSHQEHNYPTSRRLCVKRKNDDTTLRCNFIAYEMRIGQRSKASQTGFCQKQSQSHNQEIYSINEF